jgi:hypothetical protein
MMNSVWIVKPWALAAASACALLIGCSASHEPNAGTSGSNWLTCEKLADCAAAGAEGVVACSAEGFCVDAAGERIAAQAPGGSALLQEQCLWGTDALLEEVGAEVADRINCGRYGSAPKPGNVDGYGGIGCFERAFTMQRAVEIGVISSVDEDCDDCPRVTTYVATGEGSGGFAITNEAYARDGDEVREITVTECSKIVVELEPEAGVEVLPDEVYPFVVCGAHAERYHCRQPIDAPSLDEPKPEVPVTPFKLGDISAPGNIARETLHLYISNQSSEPLVNIEVAIDGALVVTGDFVPSAHTWHEFDILVPFGARTVSVQSTSHAASLEQVIEVHGKRWAVIDYWNEEPPDGERFTLSLHDEPVAFM